MWGAAVVCLSVLAASPLAAQPSISQDTASADPPLSTAQVGQIDAFVGYWLNDLSGAQTTDDVRRARNQIISQITLPQTSEAFRAAYTGSLVRQVDPLLTGAPLVVRLNVMIVLSRSGRLEVLPVAATALGDQSSAVRYWAAKTIEEIVRGISPSAPPLDEQQRQALLTALQQAVEAEREPAALAQMFSAMASLGEVDRVIESLDRRLPGHVVDRDALMLPERRAMEQLYVELVRQLADQGPIATEQSISRLARIALLYLAVSATQLDEAPALSGELIDDKTRMVEQSDLVLRWAVAQLGEVGVPPPPIGNAVRTRDWGAIVAQLDFWRRELTLAPFNFRPGELEPADLDDQ